MTIIELIKEWANFILLLSALLAVFVKPIRAGFVRLLSNMDKEQKLTHCVKELKDENKKMYSKIEKILEALEISNEIDRLILSSNIVKLYYQYIQEPAIPFYEKEMLIKSYAKYQEMGGNSFAKECYEALKDKPIKKEEA